MEKIGYLGPEGSYSQVAALAFRCGECVPYPSFYSLIAVLKSGDVSSVVLPIENTLNGGVMQNIDLLQDTDGVFAVEEKLVKIDHRLVTLKGADLSGIERIYSHVQALGQCARYIAANFPRAELKPTQSTSGCLKMIKTNRDAGIIGAHCRADGFEVSDRCISDEKVNFTQFLRVIACKEIPCVHSSKIYFSVTCRHEPGALVRLLSVLAEYRLNMTRIESRPIKDRVGEYRFFIELEADYAADNAQNALNGIRTLSSSFKLLGCY